MIEARHPRIGGLTRLLLSLCVILAPIIYFELDHPLLANPEDAVIPLDRVPVKALPAVAATEGFKMPPRERYAEVLARPPFSETRRPSLVAASEKGPVEPLAATLIGIVLASDGHHALVQHGEPAQLTRVTEGQEIDGWSIKSILRDRVIFANAGGETELKIKDVSPPPNQPPPNQPPPNQPASSQPASSQPAPSRPVQRANVPADAGAPRPALGTPRQAIAEPTQASVDFPVVASPRGGIVKRGR